MAEKQQLIKIVQELQSGNKDMAAVLYEAYYRDLHYYILKRVNDPEKAEALTQDTFIDIFDMVGTLDSSDDFVEWSRKVADWRCDAYKRMRKELLLGKVGTAVVDSVKEERKELRVEQEAVEKTELPVHEMMDVLSEEQQAAILASYIDEKKAEDEKMATSVAGVWVIFKTIEPFLRKLLVGIIATVILATIRDIGIDWGHKGTDAMIEETETFADTEAVEESGLIEETETHDESNSIEGTEMPEESSTIEETQTPEESSSIEEIETAEESNSVEETETLEESSSVETTESPEETERFDESFDVTTEGNSGIVLKPTEAIEPTESAKPTESPEPVEPETENESNQGSVGLEYNLIGSAYEVSGLGTCTDKVIEIPATYHGLPVRAIASGAFQNSDIEKIVIPEGVKRIENSAFGNCSGLVEVELPDGLTHIEGYAFGECGSLERINIPKSVVKIGDSAFILCTSLKKMDLPASVLDIGWGAFCRCYGLESITVETGNPVYYTVNNCVIKKATKELVLGCKYSVLPTDSSVSEIGGHAFCGCSGWKEVEIPEGIVKIGDSAFWGNSLRSITLPVSLTEIGYCSFFGSGNYDLKEIHYGGTIAQWEAIEKGEQWDDLLKDYVIYCSDGTMEATNQYDATESLQIVLRGTYCEVTDVIDSTETEIIIPTEYQGVPVTKIGDSAFENCRNLINITIPEGITEIGRYAFRGCSGLGAITLPESLRYLGDGAFSDCDVLYEIKIPNGVPSIGIGTFSCCYSLTAVDIPESVTQIGGYAFSSCYAMKRIHLPSGLKSLGVAAFAVCSGLEEIAVSEENQFYYSVDNCLIEKDSKTLVLGCKNSVFPQDGSVMAIGDFAFWGTHIEEIIIPDGVMNIGIGAFESCSMAKRLEIPESVVSIEDAFSGCYGLVEIIVASGNPAYYDIDNCLLERESKTLVKAGYYSEVPMDEGLICIGRGAFRGYQGREDLIIPEGVTEIAAAAFNDAKIKSITIPVSVTNINEMAFHNCENLEAIYYHGSVEQWIGIVKGNQWDEYAGEYTVYCSDGQIKK